MDSLQPDDHNRLYMPELFFADLPVLVLLLACLLRPVLVYFLRRCGRSSWLHPHDRVTAIPLLWTFGTQLLVLLNLTPILRVGTSEAHLGLVWIPQWLTWCWCLQNRGEVSKSDFTAHSLGMCATLVLFLYGGWWTGVLAVLVSFVAFAKRSSCPRSRQSLLWGTIFLVAWFRVMQPSNVMGGSWLVSSLEICVMYAVKFKYPKWFAFDRRMDGTKSSALDHDLDRARWNDSNGSMFEVKGDVEQGRLNKPGSPIGGPLLTFDSSSEDGRTVDGIEAPRSPQLMGPPSLGRGVSTESGLPPRPMNLAHLPGPPELGPRGDSTGRPMGMGHRRGISTQSSGNSWAWGLAVQDFSGASSLSPHSSEDEYDDEFDDVKSET